MHKSLTCMASNIDTTTIKIHGNALHLVYNQCIYRRLSNILWYKKYISQEFYTIKYTVN